MKKVLSRFLIAVGALVLFAGCSNFFSGSELKKDIESEIKIANAENVKILIDVVNTKAGIVTQQGDNDIKIDVPFKLDFAVSADYKFEKWAAFKKEAFEGASPVLDMDTIVYSRDFENNEKIKGYILNSDEVEFTDVLSLNTTAVSHVEDIVIVPLCWERPRVTGFSHDNSSLVYNQALNIEIKFSKPLADSKWDGKDASYKPETILSKNVYIAKDPDNPKPGDHETNPIYDESALIPFLAEGLVKITKKELKSDTTGTDITHFFYVYISNNKLVFKPLGQVPDNSYSKIGRNECTTYYCPNGDDTKEPIFINCFDNFFSVDVNNGSEYKYGRYYIEIELSKEFFDKDGLSLSTDKTFGFTAGQDNDTEPPRLLDCRYYIPDAGKIWYEGFGALTKGKESLYYLHNPDNYLTDAAVQEMAEKCRNQYFKTNWYSRRIKDRIIMYIKAADSGSSAIYPTTSANVQRISYNLYYMSDNQGKSQNKSPKVLYYNKSLEYSFDYLDAKFYRARTWDNEALEKYGWDFEKLTSQNDAAAIDLVFGTRNNQCDTCPDGLYCLEACAWDVLQNKGYEDESKTKRTYVDGGYIDSNPSNLEYSKYNTQFWFIKDTVAPSVTSSDFKLPDGYFSRNTMKDFYILRDGELDTSADRKIKDAGNEKFNSPYTYRICKILKKTEASSWTVNGLEDTGWLHTYGSTDWRVEGKDYIFKDVYKDEEWLPEGFYDNPSDYAVYAYVKDDVNNISQQVEIPINYDYTPPSVTLKEVYKDGDGRCFRFKCNELETGISKIYYSITDSDGVEYNIPESVSSANQAIYWNGIGWLTKDTDYTVDSENNVIQLKTPAVETGSALIWVYFKDFENATGGTVKFTIEDAAGNKSEEQVINW